MPRFRIRLAALALLCLCGASRLYAQATLLLEEPYSYDGAFAGTGHSAVYLSRVCAASPLKLRRCEPGEWGVVLSRYHNIAGYDWLAIPLIPYLYAVDKPENIPLFADPKLMNFLRDKYLAGVRENLPDGRGDAKNAPWYELAGSAYNRTLYGYKIETRPEQDDALIRKFNSDPNREAYNLIKRNCADFVKDVINFYYPKATHRSVINDLGVTTPRQVAKTLVRYGKHHEATQLTAFIIPQIPGMKRSRPIHGVTDSILLAKKYMAPLMFLHPVMAGSVGVAYWAGWRFRPAKDAMVFDPRRALEAPLSGEERRTYKGLLDDVRRTAAEEEAAASLLKWQKLRATGEPSLDQNGQPILRFQEADATVEIGLTRENLLNEPSPPQLVQQLLITRMESELAAGSPRASHSDVENDWKLLQKSFAQNSGNPDRSFSATGYRH
jgi:hypothetical protein